MRKIEKLFAFVSDQSGEEGILAVNLGTGWTPLVFAHKDTKMEKAKAFAQDLADEMQIEIKVIEMSVRRDIKTIKPKQPLK